jgi:hypothetical protein
VIAAREWPLDLISLDAAPECPGTVSSPRPVLE